MSRHVGILGAGQLGRMLALAGKPLGFRFRFLDPAPQPPASGLGELLTADFNDEKAVERFAAGLDLVTYEFENVPVSCVKRLAAAVPVQPAPLALETAQDRLSEKQLCGTLGIATPHFAAVSSRNEFDSALEQIGIPAVLKTRRLGYDGKGQALIKGPEGAEQAWETLGRAELILESFVPFERELSIISARSSDGAVLFYPLVENVHRLGILRQSVAPAPKVPPALEAEAKRIATLILHELDYVGVLAIELFEAGGKLLFNEMAPRVHNSGHWTIEGAETSQFENHLRAIAGMTLGGTAMHGHAAMLNFIGRVPDQKTLLEVPGSHIHLYGKTERAGRKLGHCTIVAATPEELRPRLARARELIRDDG